MAPWSRSQHRVFERALVIYPDVDLDEQWEKVADQVGLSTTEVKEHYDALIHDVSLIESSQVPLPNYKDEPTLETTMNVSLIESSQVQFPTYKDESTAVEVKEHYDALLHDVSLIESSDKDESTAEVEEYYDALLHDMSPIESGQVQLPTYKHESTAAEVKEHYDAFLHGVSLIESSYKDESTAEVEEHYDALLYDVSPLIESSYKDESTAEVEEHYDALFYDASLLESSQVEFPSYKDESTAEVEEYYDALLHDMSVIESDQVAFPTYKDESTTEVEEYYDALLHDVSLIESSQAQFPSYKDEPTLKTKTTINVSLIESGQVELPNYKDEPTLKATMNDDVPVQSRKGVAWTEEEHRFFLMGLEKYGKGDWKSIARYFVTTRTATQVASHAQKYFLRQSAPKRQRKRTSIHDTTLNDSDLVPLIDVQELQPAQEVHQFSSANNIMPHQMSGSCTF